jgi:uncharacterized protein YciI
VTPPDRFIERTCRPHPEVFSMQQYLYRIRATRLAMLTDGPTERETEIVAAHFAYLQDLVAAGTVLMAGRTTNSDERAFGIAVFVAESEAKANAIVQGDPAVKHGVMQAELFPYRIALWSPQGPGSDDGG